MRSVHSRTGKVAAVVAALVLVGGGAFAAISSSPSSSDKSDASDLPSEKAELEAALAKRQAEWQAQLEDPEFAAQVQEQKAEEREKAEAEPPDEETVDTWPTGIFDDQEAPAPGMVFLASNRWVGLVDGVSVAVYAGVSGEDTSLGRVLIMRADHGAPSGFVDVTATGHSRLWTPRARS